MLLERWRAAHNDLRFAAGALSGGFGFGGPAPSGLGARPPPIIYPETFEKGLGFGRVETVKRSGRLSSETETFGVFGARTGAPAPAGWLRPAAGERAVQTAGARKTNGFNGIYTPFGRLPEWARLPSTGGVISLRQKSGSGGWGRTSDQRINSPLRYHCATPEQKESQWRESE